MFMNRQVYTYSKLDSFAKYQYWSDLRGLPIITVTGDMQACLQDIFNRDVREGRLNKNDVGQIVSFRKLYMEILSQWTSPETKFYEQIVVNSFLRMVNDRAKREDDKNWLIGCRRNQNLLLSAIILLEEAGATPEDLDISDDRNIRLLSIVWKYLKRRYPAIDNYHSEINRLSNPKAWKDIFATVFNTGSVNTVIIHGFYYITPIQERIFRLIENAGVRLVFLIPYSKKYPFAHEIWAQTYADVNGYLPMSQWKIETAEVIRPYGEMFEGRPASPENQIKIREYAGNIDFVDQIIGVKDDGYTIYSSDAKSVNELLKDYYPEEYGERTLLSYPVGKFISVFLNLWNNEENTVILDENCLTEIFISGWLTYKGISSCYYLQDLLDILPFFRQCDTIASWEKRIVKLEQVYDNAVNIFNNNYDSDAHVARWQKIMGSPMAGFGTFSISDQRLKAVLSIIRRVLLISRELYVFKDKISIREYVNIFINLMQSEDVGTDLLHEEKEFVQKIFTKALQADEFNTRFHPADIAGALNFLLNGNMDEEEVQQTGDGIVSPLYLIDAETLRERTKVHICLCDVQNMPGAGRNYIWPLTEKLMVECQKKTGNDLIKNMMHIMSSAILCNRYFMYAALQCKKVELSWISESTGKKQAPSPYIQLIAETAGVHILQGKRSRISRNTIIAAEPGEKRVRDYDRTYLIENGPKEAKMDYSVCPLKYVMGYICEESPVIREDFLQTFAANGLMAAIVKVTQSKKKVSQEEIDRIYSNVMEMFPGLRKVEKRQIRDYLGSSSRFKDDTIVGRDNMGRFTFPEERLLVRFPDKSARERVMREYNTLMTPDGIKGINPFEAPYERPGSINLKKVCLYCQYQNHCRKSSFAADLEDIYD